MTIASPLRYPGGKSSFYDLLAQTLEMNQLGSCCMVEPYCGGAGASLELLQRGYVDRLVLNDLDPDIAAFWNSILHQNDEFVALIHSTTPTIEEWQLQHDILESKTASILQRGFATFFLNRCNRSGIIRGAGMIGGKLQSGKWKLSARYNREALAERVSRIGSMSDRISFTSIDGLEVIDLADQYAKSSAIENVFCFIDPPYVVQGHTLYMNSMDDADHIMLSNRLHQTTHFNWLLTYDNCDLIWDLYDDLNPYPIGVRYSANDRVVGSELIVADSSLLLPEAQRSKKIVI